MTKSSKSYPSDPISLLKVWLKEAEESETVNPNAMALATANSEGVPSVRMVLLKGLDQRGLVFYTNSNSQKGSEISENPTISLCFYWKSLSRQVRVDGPVSNVTNEEADEYFSSRSRSSQIGAWSSKQSSLLKNPLELERSFAFYTTKFLVGKVPRPDFWEGYCVYPELVEFWQERRFRLHDRTVYSRINDEWIMQKLYP